MTNISAINLNCIELYKDSLKHLSNISNIYLSWVNLSVLGFQYLTKLKCVDIRYCDIKDDDLKNLENIKYIKLESCMNNLTDTGVSYLKNAKTIALIYCSNITSNCLNHLMNVNDIYIYSNAKKSTPRKPLNIKMYI